MATCILCNCDDEEVVQPGQIGIDTINRASVERRDDTICARIGGAYVNGTLHHRLLIVILQGIIRDHQKVNLTSESTVFYVAMAIRSEKSKGSRFHMFYLVIEKLIKL